MKLFNHRIREDLARHALDLALGRRFVHSVEGDLEVLALPDIGDPLISHLAERTVNGLALGIENGLLERDVNVGFHRTQELYVAPRRTCAIFSDMRTAVLLLVSEVLLILAIVLLCSALQGTVGLNGGWPLSQFVFTANAQSRGAPVACALVFLLAAAVTLVAGVIGIFKQPKAGA